MPLTLPTGSAISIFNFIPSYAGLRHPFFYRANGKPRKFNRNAVQGCAVFAKNGNLHLTSGLIEDSRNTQVALFFAVLKVSPVHAKHTLS